MLRGHVLRRAGKFDAGPELVLRNFRGQAEVEKNDPTFRSDQDVRWLHVSVKLP
jgi:hypothetical protein